LFTHGFLLIRKRRESTENPRLGSQRLLSVLAVGLLRHDIQEAEAFEKVKFVGFQSYKCPERLCLVFTTSGPFERS
jgi:hypothetical protein